MNIALTLLLPNHVLGGLMDDGNNPIFFQDDEGKYSINDDFSNSANNIKESSETGNIVSEFGFTDTFKLVIDMIVLIFRVFFASIIVLHSLPAVMTLLLGIPVVLMYLFAIVGWIYK